MLKLGHTFANRYRVHELISSGPLSVLYRAFDAEQRREVALKLPGADIQGGEELQARLKQEAILGFAAIDEHVVRTLEYGETHEGRPYLVTEWLNGEPLLRLLERDGPLSTLLALSLVRDAALGLDTIHSRSMVHCDVKPENIFLCGAPGSPECVKILDLGLARPSGATPGDSDQVIAGTLQYIAPEQAANEALDVRADVYSLGVVLFRLLTGELPFDTRSPVGLLGHHLFSAPPPPSWLKEHGLAAELDRIALSAMRKNRDNRYSSMRELIDDIDRFVGGEPVVGRDLEKPDHFEPRTDDGKRAVGIIAKTAKMVDSRAVVSAGPSAGEDPSPDECSAA